jgi:hypothetical protein
VIKLKDIVNESKYDVHSAKELTFVTYGGLSATKQRGYNSKENPTMHSPPARKGIYAFVWPYIEQFLLGGYHDPKERGKGQRNRISYVRDKNGNVVNSDHPDYEKLANKEKNWSFSRTVDNKPWDDEKNDWEKEKAIYVLYNNTNRKKFKYGGEIWHHLEGYCPEWTIVNRRGGWVKTDMITFINAFKREIAKTQIPSARHPYTSVMDHLEVFIEDKI